MRRHRLVLVPALAIGVAACSSSAPVRIGIVVRGEAVPAAQFAAAEINASGGINGQLLMLRTMSAGGSTLASPAIAAAESLSQDGTVVAVVGHSFSSASLAASQIYNARGVVQVSPTSTAPLLSDAGPYTFRLVASDIHQARFLAEAIVVTGGKSRTAVFFVNDDYGRALHAELRARIAEHRVPIVYDEPYSEDRAIGNVNDIAQAVGRSRPDLLIWLGRATQLLQFVPALRQAMPSLRILASDGVDDIANAPNADGALTGVRWVRFLDLDAGDARLGSLRTRFLAKTGTPLTVETALTYDAVMLIATAAREAGVTRPAIREYLASLGSTRPAYPGATGAIAFDRSGDPRPSYVLFEISPGGIRPVNP